jgi:hypothetical protein
MVSYSDNRCLNQLCGVCPSMAPGIGAGGVEMMINQVGVNGLGAPEFTPHVKARAEPCQCARALTGKLRSRPLGAVALHVSLELSRHLQCLQIPASHWLRDLHISSAFWTYYLLLGFLDALTNALELLS